ncbi:hypothetical protein [Pseudomonas sp. BE134]|uniref:hypothetical protein n=1 Tax=Pseudomonas sp. BE134 TaxID=2817843 RepID=UPI0038621254
MGVLDAINGRWGRGTMRLARVADRSTAGNGMMPALLLTSAIAKFWWSSWAFSIRG